MSSKKPYPICIVMVLDCKKDKISATPSKYASLPTSFDTATGAPDDNCSFNNARISSKSSPGAARDTYLSSVAGSESVFLRTTNFPPGQRKLCNCAISREIVLSCCSRVSPRVQIIIHSVSKNKKEKLL